MGTIERGESNLSFSNLLKVTSTLGVSLLTLLEGVDQNLELGGRSTKESDPKLRAIKRPNPKKS